MQIKEKNGKYSIYGDDNQEHIETLKKMEDDIVSLVDAANKKIIQQRQKELKKHRKIKDTTFNRRSSLDNDKEELRDIDITEGIVNDYNPDIIESSLENTTIPVAPHKEEKKNQKEKNKKGGHRVLVFIIFVLILISAVVGIFWSDINDIINNQEEQNSVITPDATEELNESTEDINTDSEDVISVGLITAFDSDYNYELADTLSLIVEIEDNIYYYYNSYKRIVTNYDSSSDNIETLLSGLKVMIADDIETISSYLEVFESYGGENYLNTVLSRYQNLYTLVELASEGDTSSTIISRSNEYIAIDNELSAVSNNLLVTFIQDNGGSVTIEDNSITYSFSDTEISNEVEIIEE